jgi:hypothetical protein
MSDLNPAAGAIPPTLPSMQPGSLAPLGDDPAEREPIKNPFVAIEAMLRQPRRIMYQLRQPGGGRLTLAMLFVAVSCSVIYGLVVGSFSMGQQIWAAPVKIGSGLLFSGLICLPSLYIFTCLGGSQARLAEVCGLLAGLLMLMTVLLVGFAPVAWLFSQSTESVAWMGGLHLAFWAVATFFGLRFLESGFSYSRARSSLGLNTWIIIFVLVTIQMTTALRPLVGTDDNLLPKQKKLFVTHWSDVLNRPTTTPNSAPVH